MTKDEAKAIIGNKYSEILNGISTITYDGITYTFTDGPNIVSGLSYAKQVSQILGRQTVTFKDFNDVYTLSVEDFNHLLASIIIKGNTLWEKKIEKYSLLESATTSEEIEAIVNSNW